MGFASCRRTDFLPTPMTSAGILEAIAVEQLDGFADGNSSHGLEMMRFRTGECELAGGERFGRVESVGPRWLL